MKALSEGILLGPNGVKKRVGRKSSRFREKKSRFDMVLENCVRTTEVLLTQFHVTSRIYAIILFYFM